jgi:hypothetical protein
MKLATTLTARPRLLGKLRQLLVASALATTMFTAVPAYAITLQEIMTLVELEVPDEQIIKKIQKDGSTFELTPSQILELKKKGVSDKIIRFLLQTKGGAGGATPAGPAKKEEPKRELSAAEAAAEEARLKEESLRLAEEQRKREEAQRSAFANRVLQQAQKYADSGQWVRAVQVYNKFVEEGVGGIPFTPDSNEAYTAKYGIANALSRAGLVQSAANLLLEVVKSGSDKDFFDKAFLQLRDLRRKINYRPPELEDLTKLAVTSFDAKFQANFNYFVGEFMNDFGLADQAKPYLEAVGKGTSDYARAQYLLGLIAVASAAGEENLPGAVVKDASIAFQNAVLAAEDAKDKDGRPIVDLAYLALARLAYDIQQFDAAIYYYKKISKTSPKLADAFYESGWTYFLKGDTSRALGTFHALHSPFFAHRFYPELWILEATMYVNLCQKNHAEAAIKMFEERTIVLAPPLRDYLKRNRRPEDFYASFIESVNKPKSNAALVKQLQAPVLQNVEFYNIYQTVLQIEREEAKIKQNLAALGPFGQELLAKLGQLRAENISAAGVVIQKTLRGTQKELETYQDKLDQLRLDIAELEYDKLDAAEGGPAVGEAVATEGTVAIAGSDSMVWPFEGEFWRDEIGAYRSFLKSKCVEAKE